MPKDIKKTNNMELLNNEEVLENYDDLELGPQSKSDNLFTYF